MPTNPHLILCNGASPKARRPKEWDTHKPQRLSTFGRSANVTLKITDLTDRMVEKLPPVVHDLMELAALVYAADQSCQRTPGKTPDWGEKWHRTFRFEMLVREPDFWNQTDIGNSLTDTLCFLSGDNYEFDFKKQDNPPQFPEYLEFNQATGLPDPVDRVILFSGGLDSLAGAVEDILVNRRRVALVSHKPVDHLAVKQRDLVAEISRRARDPKLAPIHFPVKANKIGDLSLEYSQRSRSFLYASMAASVARYFGLDQIHFYENGIVSVNLPLSQQEVGTRATRTTHPQTLARFSRIFSQVMGVPFEVVNEFFWETKQDVLERLKRSNHMDLARNTLSCTRTRGFTNASPHCGVCSQCLSRRIAALGAAYGDNDPASGYRSDVLLAARTKDANRILAERFVGAALEIEQMNSTEEFNQQFAGEMGRIYPHIDLPSDVAAAKLFDLHHRHARQVGAVMASQMALHADERRRGRLADTCMLNYAFDAGRPAESRSTKAALALEEPGLRLRISIGDPGMPSMVDGKAKRPLTDAERAVVGALLEAGDAGLAKDSLEKVRSSARRILKELRKDADWARAILMPGRTNARYRLRA